LPSDSHALLRRKIERWFDCEGIVFKSLPDLNSYFHLVAELKNASIHVHESKVRKGCLVVQGTLALGQDQLSRIGKVVQEEKRSLFLSLFSMLDKTEYHFMLQEDFTSQFWLKIQRTLYVEELTRTALLREMKDLNTRFVNINYTLNEALGVMVPVSIDTPIYA
jgi:hypothetical protein